MNVGGNIQAEGAVDVTINNSSKVDGSVQVKQGGGATVDQVQIAGNLRLAANQRAERHAQPGRRRPAGDRQSGRHRRARKYCGWCSAMPAKHAATAGGGQSGCLPAGAVRRTQCADLPAGNQCNAYSEVDRASYVTGHQACSEYEGMAGDS